MPHEARHDLPQDSPSNSPPPSPPNCIVRYEAFQEELHEAGPHYYLHDGVDPHYHFRCGDFECTFDVHDAGPDTLQALLNRQNVNCNRDRDHEHVILRNSSGTTLLDDYHDGVEPHADLAVAVREEQGDDADSDYTRSLRARLHQSHEELATLRQQLEEVQLIFGSATEERARRAARREEADHQQEEDHRISFVLQGPREDEEIEGDDDGQADDEHEELPPGAIGRVSTSLPRWHQTPNWNRHASWAPGGGLVHEAFFGEPAPFLGRGHPDPYADMMDNDSDAEDLFPSDVGGVSRQHLMHMLVEFTRGNRDVLRLVSSLISRGIGLRIAMGMALEVEDRSWLGGRGRAVETLFDAIEREREGIADDLVESTERDDGLTRLVAPLQWSEEMHAEFEARARAILDRAAPGLTRDRTQRSAGNCT